MLSLSLACCYLFEKGTNLRTKLRIENYVFRYLIAEQMLRCIFCGNARIQSRFIQTELHSPKLQLSLKRVEREDSFRIFDPSLHLHVKITTYLLTPPINGDIAMLHKVILQFSITTIKVKDTCIVLQTEQWRISCTGST
jgi:hypothetical protein